MFRIKLKWGMNIQINVDTRLRYCIIINNKHVYECDKDSYQKIKTLYTHIHNENYKLPEKGKEILNDILKNY